MSTLKVTLDVKELENGLNTLAKNADMVRDKGLEQAGLALWDDTMNIEPKPPVDTGNLRGAGTLFVGTKNIKSEGAATRSHSGKKGTATFGIDTPYAAYQHELPQMNNHNRPEANSGVGPKFIESKLSRFRDDYTEIAAKEISIQIDNL